MHPRILFLVATVTALSLIGCSGGGGESTCGPDTCPGCCTLDGHCETGSSDSACGTSGATCAACGTGEQCNAFGRCEAKSPRPDSGSPGREDAGTLPDSGVVDPGEVDAGETSDAGTADAGPDDAGTPDAGTDAGIPDAGQPSVCDTAPVLPLGTVVTGDTTGKPSTGENYCGGHNAPDQLYRVTIPTRGTLVTRVSSTSTDGGFFPVSYTRPSCVSGPSGEANNGCASNYAGVATVQAVVPDMAPGNYFFWVDSADTRGGPFEASVDVVPDGGEDCPTALPLDLSHGPVKVTGPYYGFSDQLQSSCGGTGPDVAFTVDVHEPSDLYASVAGGNLFSRSALVLQQGCGGRELACSREGSSGYVNLATQVQPGTYTLWVDTLGTPLSYDEFELRAELKPPSPPGAHCFNPKPLVFSKGGAGGVATDSAAVDGMFEDDVPSCGNQWAAPDVLYSFTTTEPLRLRATVTSRTSGFRPAMSLRDGTCGSGKELKCVSNYYNEIDAAWLPAGTYYLVVDGDSSSTGAYDLTAELTPPPLGDTCNNPKPLVFTNGTATDHVDTRVMLNDLYPACGVVTMVEDMVYAFSTTDVRTLRATVTPSEADSYARPVLTLRTTQCDYGLSPACQEAPDYGKPATLVAGSLPPGNYFLHLEGGGTFDVNASLFAPPPGDACGQPKPLTFSSGGAGGTASAAGDTSSLQLANDSSGSCGGYGIADEVYTFTTTEPLDLTATVSTPSGTFQPALSLTQPGSYDATCKGSELSCAAASAAGGPATLVDNALPPGTYYLWVDGYEGTGPYTLDATLSRPAPGDSCLNPEPLAFSNGAAGGTATVTDTTEGLFHDSYGGCGGYSGGDRVYRFTTDRPLNLRASVSGASGFQPVVYLRSGSDCANASQLACGRAATAGGTASITRSSLPAGTYYLWVDSDSARGGYTLTAQLDTPPEGESCLVPKPLVFSNGTAGGTATVTGDTSGFLEDSYAWCGTNKSEPDTVYSFTTKTTLTLDAAVSVASADSTFKPVVYLRQSPDCATQGRELNCGLGYFTDQPAHLRDHSLPPGTYFLWVDGAYGTSGAYDLKANLIPPVAGDDCDSPRTLTFSQGASGGTATATGDTTGTFDDASDTCGGQGSSDVVFTFTTNKALTFNATATPSSSGFTPVLSLRYGACQAGSNACGAATVAGDAASLSNVRLNAGTYYLWVDGASASAGAFSLSASLAP